MSAPKPKSREKVAPAQLSEAQFAAQVGELVRLGRARRGISRKQLAQASDVSERYLAQIEGGEGNPSLIVLRAIAQAIEVPVVELVPRENAGNATYARVLELVGRVPPSELSELADGIERKLSGEPATDRARRIALVGLRGAGKSTLGQKLAKELGCPFVEINRIVERDYGASVSILIENSGVGAFRRYEKAALERVIEDNTRVIIATAGGIVANPDTYALLLRRCHTIWLQASPQEHMSRVMEQGDFRPMAKNREAMADLNAILAARSADYGRAEATVDTAGKTIEQSFAKLKRVAAEFVK